MSEVRVPSGDLFHGPPARYDVPISTVLLHEHVHNPTAVLPQSLDKAEEEETSSHLMALWYTSTRSNGMGYKDGEEIASFPGCRRNGLATSVSSNCYFRCLKVGSTNQISECSHMTTVKPNCVMH